MPTTTTLYITLSHAYPAEVACAAPATCTDPEHWDAQDDQFPSLEEAQYSAKHWHDAPAVRITKKTTVVTETLEDVETIDNPWTEEEQ